MSTTTPYHNAGGGRPPVVVQGYEVKPHQQQHQQQHHNASSMYNNHDSNNNNNVKLHEPLDVESHPVRPSDNNRSTCRDVIWAIIFYGHLAVMLYCAVVYAPQMLQQVGVASDYYDNNNNDENGGGEDNEQEGDGDGEERGLRRLVSNQIDNANTNDNSSRGLLSRSVHFTSRYLQDNDNDDDAVVANPDVVIVVMVLTVIVGFVISTASMGLMIHFAEALIKIALIGNIILFGFMAMLSLAVGAVPTALMMLFMCGFGVYYTMKVWPRIPFSASNLVTAVSAVRANIGLALYAYLSIGILLLWTVFWSIAAMSTIYVVNGCDYESGECETDPNPALVFGFVLSYYWTAQVVANVVHVTTAGTVGSWWFTPQEANSCCSSAVRQSYFRSLTTSFGSICLGSLIVALIQAIREMVRSSQENGDSLLVCCADCLLGCIERLVEYFNKWAFVYVGLYGFSFMESGKAVMTLFRQRGWTSIITDYMIDTVLFLVSLGVGVLTGVLAVIVGAALQVGSGEILATVFVIGWIVGYFVSATLFSIVSSAANTVIVCYAEAPNEFQTNHPELSDRMRTSWRQAWPNEFQY